MTRGISGKFRSIPLLVVMSVGFCVIGCNPSIPKDHAAGTPPQNETPKNKESMCGLQALQHALMRYGIPAPLSALEEDTRFSKNGGVSLLELKRLAERHGLIAEGHRLTWAELTATGKLAILHTDGDHYVCAVASQTTEKSGLEAMLIHDEKRSTWYTERELSEHWRGECLILEPTELEPHPADGPRMALHTCLVNVGNLRNDSVAKATFEIRNCGRDTLKIGVDPDCGCTEAILSAEILGPQEVAHLSLVLDLSEKAGWFSVGAALSSNDPARPSVELLIQGRAIRDRLTASERLALPVVRPGDSLNRPIVLMDPGTDSLKLLSVECTLDESVSDGIRALTDLTVDWFPVLRAGQPGIAPARPGDYICALSIRPHSECPLGKLAGQIVILSDDGFRKRETVLSFSGRVGYPLKADPGSLYFVLTQNSFFFQKDVRIEKEHPARITSVRSGDLPVTVAIHEEGLVHVVRVSTDTLPPATVSGSLDFEFTDGNSLGIPCTVVVREESTKRLLGST